MQRYVGVDVSKRRCRACIMDYEGFVLDEFNFENNSDGIEDWSGPLFLRTLFPSFYRYF